MLITCAFVHRWATFMVPDVAAVKVLQDGAPMMDEALRTLSALADAEEPFFLTLQFNGTHYPSFFHAEHQGWPDDGTKSTRYDNSILCMDIELARLRAGLREAEVDDETIIVFAADPLEQRNLLLEPPEHQSHRVREAHGQALAVVRGTPVLS